MQFKNIFLVIFSGLVTTFIGTQLHAQVHSGDVVLKVIDNEIVTGVDSGGFSPSRVFSAELGEIIQNEVDEPGFDNEVGTFPADSSIRFNIIDSLRKWDGSDFDSLATETMGIRFGTSLGPISTPTEPSIVEGFALNVADDGSWHRHYDFVLSSPASDGIYLLSLSLDNSSEAISVSEPFHVVFNQNESELTHDAAISYVESVLVPEPSGGIIAGMAGLVLCFLVARHRLR